jgi:uncharacterized protein involved in response to NO
MSTRTMPIQNPAVDASIPQILARERQKSLMLRAWIVAGLFFMALPGTLLGFSNLMAIASHHGLGALSPAWIQGHGHAQVFGWIGSFILGIGFYSQPTSKTRSVIRLPLACFVLWTTGVAMRWLASIYGWHWRILLPLSASMELAAQILFLVAASHHKLPDAGPKRAQQPRVELWMKTVLVGTAGLTFALGFNFVECIRLAITGTAPAFPHGLDQRYLVLLAWGFLTPFVWGFSARWLPAFLAVPRPSSRLMRAALALAIGGVLAGLAGFVLAATVLLLLGALLIAPALHLLQRPQGNAKTQGIHPSFPVFARLSYLWLVVAASLGVWAALADRHGGIWGASRHALTVGFAANMVLTIGPRILPHFTGVRALFSKRLMFASLLLLQLGCSLRVFSEPLAYEGLAHFAWTTLPVSGFLELSAILIFALNMGLTVLAGQSSFAEAQA